MIASMVRRSSLRGRAPRILTAAIAASNLAHWASVSTCIVYPRLYPQKTSSADDSPSVELRTGPRMTLVVARLVSGIITAVCDTGITQNDDYLGIRDSRVKLCIL